LRIRVEDGYHSIVRVGKFNELANEVRGRLTSNGFVVVVGPKGIGKSTLAAAVIWELFVNGDIGLVARVDRLDAENYPKFVTFVENYGEKFGRLLILYDPVSTEAYERVDIDVKAPIQTNIERTVRNLMKVVNSISPKASKPLTLIVLPSDIYNTLSEKTRNALEKEKYRLDVSQALSDREFLAGLIREYTRTKGNPNGCALSDRELNELAGKVAGFDSGHALIARLVGEELARNNCSVGKVEKLINKAKGKAEKFIILHINGLFKVHEDPDTAKALVEIFALRRPFVNEVGPGDPILTPGIVGLIGEVRGTKVLYGVQGGELRSWLARRQHDLIEDSIGGLLKCIVSEGEECKKFDDELLEPWRDVHVPKIRSRTDAVKYFTRKYGKRFIKKLRRHKNCWKRAALIIGYASAGHVSVPRPEDFPESLRKDVVESLGDALRECGVDDYLLVGDKIPLLIMNLTKDHAYALTEAFVDKYNEAVSEERRVLSITRGRDISDAEKFYGLGLASIIAKAVESGKPVGPSDADTALHIASFAIQRVASPDLIKSVLGALEPLRAEAPQRYLELLAPIPDIENLNRDTVKYILNELNEVLGSYGDVVKGHAWSLVHAIIAYAYLLWVYRGYFDDDEVKDVVGRVADLLKELDKFKSSLGVIAWAYALAPALDYVYVRRPMEEKLGINVVRRANKILKKLNKMRGRVQDLMRDEEFMSYIESKYIKADEGAARKEILETASRLKHALARYRLNNNELKEAKELFKDAAEEYREIGAYENYLIARSWALRTEVIKGSLVSKKLVGEFRRLYEKTFKEEHFRLTAKYLSTASLILGNYLMSLALINDVEEIRKMLEEHLWVLNAYGQVSVLTRLMLNALLGHRVGLSGKLEGKLGVNPEELINAFETDMHSEFLPALRVAFGKVGLEDGYEECKSIEDSTKRGDCEGAVLATMDDSDAVGWLRGKLINYFRKQILENEGSGWLRKLGFDANVLINEFKGLVNGLDGKSLAQLIAPGDSMAQFVLMLHALINGNKELARAHALYGAVVTTGSKLVSRLSLKAYRACCDLKRKRFRCAIVKRFFYHV
jgi:KaiC/GvpD/RAD55 family RecA-like ATPase